MPEPLMALVMTYEPLKVLVAAAESGRISWAVAN
jgi:hypothetical protein